MPSLIRSFQGINLSPEDVYAEFAKAATTAVTNTKDFVALMKSRSSQDVLLEARKSRLEDPDNITDWLAEQHEDWFDKPLMSEVQKDPGYDLDQSETTRTNTSLEDAVQSFQNSHPDAKIIALAEGHEAQV